MEVKVHAPAIGELPTKQQLNRATLVAAGVAALILVTTILPSEYGIDPTGVGRVFGLTEMGEAKRAAAAASHAAADTGDTLLDDAAAPAPVPAGDGRSGEVTLTLQPGEGAEVKATMQAGGEFAYQWSTGGPVVNFELHGEEIGAASDVYTTYEKGKSAGASGTFRAPFGGTHGWFWRNRTAAPVTITVRANGAFDNFAHVK